MRVVCLLILLPLGLGASFASERSELTQVLETKDGIRFGLWSKEVTLPAPTILLFDPGTVERLSDPYYQRRYQTLIDNGYLGVAVDFPCQGRDERAGEPKNLDCWRHRIEHSQETFGADFNSRIGEVLDHLIERGHADPRKVVVGGSSAGGFLALHYTAQDPRIRGAAVVAPVTDLSVLEEFDGVRQLPAVRALSLTQKAKTLADRSVWMLIGDRDARVGTDSAIEFARSVWKVTTEKKLKTGVELHIVPEPGGHTYPWDSHERAANWILNLNR